MHQHTLERNQNYLACSQLNCHYYIPAPQEPEETGTQTPITPENTPPRPQNTPKRNVRA